MNGRYAGYDLESFANGYQAIPQTQQRYMSTNGPCLEDYDPTRIMESIAMYNPTAARTNGATPQAHYHAFMPAQNAAQHSASGGVGLAGMGDFEPIPLSKATMRRLGTQRQQPHQNQNYAVNNIDNNGNDDNFVHAPASFSDMFFTPSVGSKPPYPNPDQWLEDLKVTVSGLSLEPMAATELVARVRSKTEDVVTRYLPCVDFLVACQQDLRKGLAAASQKRLVHSMFRDSMTPKQFYSSYIAPLPERFLRKNRRIMEPLVLEQAVQELHKLCKDARAVEHQGCEAIKNTFLGGMKDGESWGLRKWLSKNGGALHICNDCECILHACQKLDRSLESTRKLSERLRPLAKQALTRLKADVPSSYQEISTAHPYLPFFHRLESALKGLSNFDPDDDDVVCIDDEDEVEEMKAKAQASSKSTSKKRKASGSNGNVEGNKLAANDEAQRSDQSDDNSDDGSVIEVIEVKPAAKKSKKSIGPGEDQESEYMNALAFFSSFEDAISGTSDPFDVGSDNSGASSAVAHSPSSLRMNAYEMAGAIDRLAVLFESDQYSTIRPPNVTDGSFWDHPDRYACALRLLSDILRSPSASPHVDSVDDDELVARGLPAYSKVIRHPICFREIVTALIEENFDGDDSLTGSNGQLPCKSLSSWNMWKGLDLLQAIDLVMLNSLAYGKVTDEGKTAARSNTNKLRKSFWAGIKTILDLSVGAGDSEMRRGCTPTRRGESSGFVVHKSR